MTFTPSHGHARWGHPQRESITTFDLFDRIRGRLEP